MKKLVAFCRTTVFLGGLCLFLLTTTIGAITWGLQTAAAATAVTSAAVAKAVTAAQAKARTRQTKAVMKTKAKARIRRSVAAIPILGAAALLYFEEKDYRDWLAETPNGSRQQYGCEVLGLSAEVLDEVLQELPERVRPDADTVLKLMPKCEPAQEAQV